MRALQLLLLSAAIHPGLALGAIDTVRVDLGPLIEAAAGNPEQFAVEVPHFVSLSHSGTWAGTGGTRTLRYAVSVPGAVSLSFHATRIHLPPSATLTVSSEATTAIYRSTDVHDEVLWSRIQPGDALEFTLEVRTDEVALVALEISGSRPATGDWKRECAATRYIDACAPRRRATRTHTASRTMPAIRLRQIRLGQATVALTISNRYLCTGTLVTDTARDNTPYILTARHCANGDFDGPSAMCPMSPSTGTPSAPAVKRWERCCTRPVRGARPARRPSTHSRTRGCCGWMKAPSWKTRTSPDSTPRRGRRRGLLDPPCPGLQPAVHTLAWSCVPLRHGAGERAAIPARSARRGKRVGVGGPGASGGALLSQNHRIVGIASLAQGPASQSGYDQCPAINPPSPDESSAAVLYNAIAGVWNMTSTGTLGSVTLKSLLDRRAPAPQRWTACLRAGCSSLPGTTRP